MLTSFAAWWACETENKWINGFTGDLNSICQLKATRKRGKHLVRCQSNDPKSLSCYSFDSHSWTLREWELVGCSLYITRDVDYRATSWYIAFLVKQKSLLTPRVGVPTAPNNWQCSNSRCRSERSFKDPTDSVVSPCWGKNQFRPILIMATV